MVTTLADLDDYYRYFYFRGDVCNWFNNGQVTTCCEIWIDSKD